MLGNLNLIEKFLLQNITTPSQIKTIKYILYNHITYIWERITMIVQDAV